MKEFFEEFIKSYDMHNPRINYKYYHSYRVMDLMHLLAKDKKLSPDDTKIAECIGLFHDIGRFIQEEHCIEYVYSAILNVPISALQCGEGERLCLFTYVQTKLLNWSPYHRQVFEKVYFLLQREQNVPKKSVLFYTKILPPAVGGYVTAGRCFIDAFKDICNLTIVTDIPCDSTEHKDYEPANIIAPSECKRYEKKHFDLLFFNATYEKTETLVSLMDLCQNTWSFEHNPLLVNYRLEMIKRFYVVDHLYVPSPFLKNDLQASTGSI